MIGKPIYGKGFKGLAAYLAKGALPTKERAKDERIVEERRVAWSYSRNLAGLDPETDWKLATRTMKATAAMSARTEKPVLHLPLSWPAADTERLTPEAMR
jgi:DNA-directed RNA polymerase subunit F